MTEAEWLACTDPTLILEYLRGKVSDRKLRLFAIACCRRVWDLIGVEECRRAVEKAEQCVEGMVSQNELTIAYRVASAAVSRLSGVASCQEAAFAACQAAAAELDVQSIAEANRDAAAYLAGYETDRNDNDLADDVAFQEADVAFQEAMAAESQVQADLLRCVMGNPFLPGGLAPSWLTHDTVALAASAYEDKAFERLPVLADALEEAGCTSNHILSHCRGPGPHVRGCWVVDALLRKA